MKLFAFLFSFSFLLNSHALQLTEGTMQHLAKNGDLISRRTHNFLASESLNAELRRVTDGVATTETIRKIVEILKQMREVNRETLNIQNEIFHEVLAFGKINPNSEALNPAHPLSVDLLSLAIDQKKSNEYLLEFAKRFTVLLTKWEALDGPFEEVAHIGDLCSSQAAESLGLTLCG